MKKAKLMLLLACTFIVHQSKAQLFLEPGDVHVSVIGGYADVNSLNLYLTEYIENNNEDWQPSALGPIGFEVLWSSSKNVVSGLNYSYVQAQTGIQLDNNIIALYKTEYKAHQILYDAYYAYLNDPKYGMFYIGTSAGLRLIDYKNNYVEYDFVNGSAELPFEISQFAFHFTLIGIKSNIAESNVSYTMELGYGAKGLGRIGLGYTF